MKEENSKQVDEFKIYISGVFSRAAADYDHVGPRFFAYFGRKLVEFADIGEGARVLDIACGRGAVLFPALTAVSVSGEVSGIDISAAMVDLLEKEIAQRGIDNASVAVMDAENLEFEEATFDAVLCGLGLFFLPDLERALSEILHVLKLGGILAASTFRKDEDDIEKRWTELNSSFKDHLGPMPSVNVQPLDNEDEVRDVFSKAGFENIVVVSDEHSFDFNNEEEWWQWMWSHGNRGFLERLDSEVVDDYREQALKFFVDEDSGRLTTGDWHLLYSQGRKAT